MFSAVIYGGSSRKNQIFQCEAGRIFEIKEPLLISLIYLRG
jgi:hypothetical protein